MICLDTNAVIKILNETGSQVELRLRAALKERQSIAISSIVLFELWHGAMKSARIQDNTERIEEFLAAPTEVLAFDSDDAREAGDIRAALEKIGKSIGPYDILIAAQARRRGAVLVTANEREFARVPGLHTEDWAT